MAIVTKENAERLAFETFSDLHPFEAFYYDKERFCDYVREKMNVNISNEDIKKLIDELRD
ncbi:MAG: hypothetical protein K9J13_17540 [Saprospiraceae bacterium]|nr:hypothetical protein [Saprospiraceae bacterium]